MLSSSRPLGLVAILAVLAAPLYANPANPAVPKASAPAGQPAQASASASATEAKPASAAPTAQAAAAPSAQPAQSAQPAGEGVSVANAPASAGGKSCEDVKAGIDAKIKARGVKAFTLDIVGKDEAKDAKVVGNCEGGKKLITYKRG
jgi:hypothetical protein